MAASATLLSVGGCASQAQGWETYPQGPFVPHFLAAQADGTTAYAVQENPPLIRRGDLGGTVWQPTSLPAGCYRADGIALAHDGTIYLTGWRYLSDGTTRAPRVWASLDQGNTWSEVATFLTTSVRGISVNARGEIFLVTTVITGTTAKFTLSRLRTYRGLPNASAALGVAWNLVDEYSPTGNYANYPNSLTIRPSSHLNQPSEVWVAGYAVDAKTLNTRFPVVRRSVDNGDTWVTVNSFPVPGGYSFNSGSWSVVAGADADGVGYLCASFGKTVRKTTERYWLTYRSLDGGGSWTQVDTLPVGAAYGPDALATDTLGGVFMAGGGFLRASTAYGAAWVSPNLPGVGSVAADLAGNVFAGGYSTEGVVYKLPAPLSP